MNKRIIILFVLLQLIDNNLLFWSNVTFLINDTAKMHRKKNFPYYESQVCINTKKKEKKNYS